MRNPTRSGVVAAWVGLLALAVIVAGAPASAAARDEGPAAAETLATIVQGTSLASAVDERSFAMESTSFFDVFFDLSTVSRDLQSFAIRGSVQTVVRGYIDGGPADCVSYMTGSYEGVSTLYGPMTGSDVVVDTCTVSMSHDGPPSAPAGGSFRFNQSLALRIGARSQVFATWSTVGFFQVQETADPQVRHRFFAIVDRSLTLNGSIGDPSGDAVWLDVNFPTWTDSAGRRFKPLFAFHVIDLDGKVSVNVHGNVRAPGSATIELRQGLRHPVVFLPYVEKPPIFTTFRGTFRDSSGSYAIDGSTIPSWQSTPGFGSVVLQGTANY